MIEHVAYEVWMLEESMRLLSLAQSLRLGRPWESAILESLLVHVRNLLFFLYPPQDSDIKDGDVLASDYPSAVTLPRRIDEEARLVNATPSEISNAVSRRIAHIHTTRGDDGVSWSFVAIATALIHRSVRYLASVEEPFAPAIRAEFRKLGWALDEIVANLPPNEGFIGDVRAMRPNP